MHASSQHHVSGLAHVIEVIAIVAILITGVAGTVIWVYLLVVSNKPERFALPPRVAGTERCASYFAATFIGSLTFGKVSNSLAQSWPSIFSTLRI